MPATLHQNDSRPDPHPLDAPTPVSHRDLEMAARYAEARAHALRTEADTATTTWARESLTRDAREHEDRARRYRRAANPNLITRADADEAIETLRAYLQRHSSREDARRLKQALRRLHDQLAQAA